MCPVVNVINTTEKRAEVNLDHYFACTRPFSRYD